MKNKTKPKPKVRNATCSFDYAISIAFDCISKRRSDRYLMSKYGIYGNTFHDVITSLQHSGMIKFKIIPAAEMDRNDGIKFFVVANVSKALARKMRVALSEKLDRKKLFTNEQVRKIVDNAIKNRFAENKLRLTP